MIHLLGKIVMKLRGGLEKVTKRLNDIYLRSTNE